LGVRASPPSSTFEGPPPPLPPICRDPLAPVFFYFLFSLRFIVGGVRQKSPCFLEGNRFFPDLSSVPGSFRLFVFVLDFMFFSFLFLLRVSTGAGMRLRFLVWVFVPPWLACGSLPLEGDQRCVSSLSFFFFGSSFSFFSPFPFFLQGKSPCCGSSPFDPFPSQGIVDANQNYFAKKA